MRYMINALTESNYKLPNENIQSNIEKKWIQSSKS